MISKENRGWLLLAATLIRTGEDAHDEIFLSSEWYKTLKGLLSLCLETDMICSNIYAHVHSGAKLWTGKEQPQ